MTKTITATEAARRFSDLLNRIRFRGERYLIARGGKPVATLAPADTAVDKTIDELPALLKQLPSLGEDAGSFAQDVLAAVKAAPELPAKPSWD